jgi:glycosyltransferase involved in cell wall biosynthesis
VVYAGGSRFVAGEEGWEKTDGDIEGPRLAADPVWLLDALRCAVREIVCDGVNGLLVAPEEPGTVADAVPRLRDDRARAERIAERARESVRREFDGERLAGTLQALFREAMA